MTDKPEAEEEQGRDPGSIGRKLTVGAVAVAVVVMALVAGLFAYKGHKKQVDETAIRAAVTESTTVLRDALAGQPGDAVARLDPLLARVKAAERTPLADAAEDYVLGAREIGKRSAEVMRLAPQTAAARQALLAHLGAGGRRGDAWFKQAGDLKKRVEGAYFDLGVQLKALDGLIDGMHESRKRVGALAGDKIVIDGPALVAGREKVLEEIKRAAEELERARQIPIG